MSRKRGRPQPRRQVEKANTGTVAVPSGSRLYTQTEMLAAVTAAGQYSRPLPRNPYDAVVPFGPGLPLTPAGINPPGRSGRPEPRQYDYPVSWNLPGFSDRCVPWSILRSAADQIPLFRQCIQVRKDEIATLDWSVTVSERAVDLALEQDPGALREDIEKDMRKRCAPHISRLTQFWEEPDRRNGLDFIGWASKALEEHFVLDALPVYARRTRGGDPYSLEILDGTTIKPLLDQYGHRPLPPNPAYQQILQGFPRGEFVADTAEGPDGPVIADAYRSDQLSYLVHNIRTMSPYGLSSVEQALTDGDLWLRRHGWLKAEYSDGVMPSGWLLAGEGQADWDPSQLREYERAINDYYSGQTENRHRYRILPWGMTPQQQADQGERYKPDYDLFLLKLVCRHFDTTMAELGFTEPGGLGSAGWHAGQADVQDRAGTKPTQRRLQSWCTRLMRLYLDAPPELVFQIKGLEAEDELTDDQVAGARVGSGRMTLNEDRDRQGKARYAFPEADKPYIQTPTGLIFIEGQEEAAAQGLAMQQQIADSKTTPPGAEPLPGDAEAQDDTTDGQDAQDEAAVAAAQAKADEYAQYARWRRKVKNPARPFTFWANKADDLPLLNPAVDPVVFKNDPEAGGVDPKEPTPEQAWPGWMYDEEIAAAAAGTLSLALLGAWTGSTIRSLVAAYPEKLESTTIQKWLGQQGQAGAFERAIRPVLVDLWTEGYLVGDRSAVSLLTGHPADWSGWAAGRPAAARRLVSADGRTAGLDMLLSEGDAVIKSIAVHKQGELAVVLADGLERGLGVDEVTRNVRGLLGDRKKARLVTATELQRAQTRAALDRYDIDDIPGVRWLVFPGACPRCQANADVGAIPLGDAFPSGVLGPPGHPNCRCEIVPELDLDRVQLEPDGYGLEKWDAQLHPRGPDGKFIPTVGGTARLARNLKRAQKAGKNVDRHMEALNRRLAYHQANTPAAPEQPPGRELTGYHFTYSEIEGGQLRVGEGQNQAFFGRGVYLHTDKQHADMELAGARDYIDEDTRQLTATATVRNPFEVKVPAGEEDPGRAMHRAMVAAGHAKPGEKLKPAEMTRRLRAAGHDSVLVHQASYNPEVGGSQIAVFDAAAVKITHDPGVAGPAGGAVPAAEPAAPKAKKLMEDAFAAPADASANAAFKRHMKATEYTHPGSGLSVKLSSTRVTGQHSDAVLRGRAMYTITDRDGKKKGKATRFWEVDDKGALTVDHHYLELDKDVQGAGFASGWNAHAEKFYRDNDVKSIGLNANLDVGGYAWAKQGYDWDGRNSMNLVAFTLEHRITQSDHTLGMVEDLAGLGHPDASAVYRSERAPFTPEERALLKDTMSRMTRENWDAGTAPTPLEVAMLGWEPGAKDWVGKRVMLGMSWDGVKTL